MRNAQRNAYIQLHVVSAALWNLSGWRFTRVCSGRAENELRTDCRWSSRVPNTHEIGLSREGRRRNITRHRRDRRHGFTKRDAVRAWSEKVCRQKWGWPARGWIGPRW